LKAGGRIFLLALGRHLLVGHGSWADDLETYFGGRSCERWTVSIGFIHYEYDAYLFYFWVVFSCYKEWVEKQFQ